MYKVVRYECTPLLHRELDSLLSWAEAKEEEQEEEKAEEKHKPASEGAY